MGGKVQLDLDVRRAQCRDKEAKALIDSWIEAEGVEVVNFKVAKALGQAHLTSAEVLSSFYSYDKEGGVIEDDVTRTAVTTHKPVQTEFGIASFDMIADHMPAYVREEFESAVNDESKDVFKLLQMCKACNLDPSIVKDEVM